MTEKTIISMKIAGHAVKGSIFELVKTVEVDIQLSDEIAWTNRLEIFRDSEQTNRYRCRVWELEMFRLTPSHARNADDGTSRTANETIMVERGTTRRGIASRLYTPFEAAGVNEVVEMIVDDLNRFLEKNVSVNTD